MSYVRFWYANSPLSITETFGSFRLLLKWMFCFIASGTHGKSPIYSGSGNPACKSEPFVLGFSILLAA
jgi:hypothetical protein